MLVHYMFPVAIKNKCLILTSWPSIFCSPDFSTAVHILSPAFDHLCTFSSTWNYMTYEMDVDSLPSFGPTATSFPSSLSLSLNMTSLLLLTGAVVILAFWFLSHSLTPSHDPKEPPLIPPKIPLVGHIIGLLRDGTGYYPRIAFVSEINPITLTLSLTTCMTSSKECSQPIFTLGLPRAKMYVVTSSNLITACDRRAKIVSFAPYVVEFGRRILMSSQHGIHLLSEDLHEEKGPISLRPETMKAMHQSLLPSDRLQEITQAVLSNMLGYLDSASNVDDQKGVPLFQWIRQFVSTASTNAVYGPEKNPMRDPEIMNGFW